LRELGYSEGSSIIIEWRRAEDREDLAAPLAFELVQRQVDLIVTVGVRCARRIGRYCNYSDRVSIWRARYRVVLPQVLHARTGMRRVYRF
jgi:hypothetical protein